MFFLADIQLLEGALVLVAGIGLGAALFLWRNRQRRALTKAELDHAKREAETLIREARLKGEEELPRLRKQAEEALASQERDLREAERRLNERESLVNRQLATVVEDERKSREFKQELERQSADLERRQTELADLQQRRREELQKLSGISETEARAKFLNEVQQESLKDAAALSRHILDEAKAEAEQKARRIVSMAIQRYAGQHTYETTTATVALTGDEMKGRIIGREGRNIRAFEATTGVTVLIDDTPGAVVLSGFDPVRREIAREAMHRLIQDGRIHPTRIEEVVAQVSREMDETIQQAGEEAVFKTGLPPLHPEIVKVLGRLRFRLSFTQNVLDHSIEVAHLTGLMAAELGLDVITAKRAGLLHDIGKALSHEIEGPHAIVGAELVKRHGEPEPVVNGVASHHGEVPHTGPYGILVGAADAISASRPGARSESMTIYLRRLEELEKIAMSFAGIERAYATQAGRELRVMVKPEEITDEAAYALARQISRRIEDELHYPGQIRVTLIRETRVVEFAK